ncbi:MAG TPA: hypothetical protein VLI05_05105 [Candidatus Saccharimonadia bacterium]|nr:hypothetical protein [Candidatus Saccharimonadia bacterium]
MLELPESQSYDVFAELAAPDVAAERAFVRTERQYVARQLADRPSALGRFGRWAEQAPDQAAWRHYDQALVRYAHQLDEAEAERRQGLTPIKLLVTCNGQPPARRIHVVVTVHDGRLQAGKRPPKRPLAADRTEPINWLAFFSYHGFWRSRMQTKPHRVEARLSGLDYGQTAYLIDAPLYLHQTAQTRLTYSIDWSGAAAPLQGEVLAIQPPDRA